MPAAGGLNAEVQPKLVVGPIGDKYEQEADRVAAEVMSQAGVPAPPPAVQRTGDEELDVQAKTAIQRHEEEIQAKPLAESITPLVQRHAEEYQAQRAPGGEQSGAGFAVDSSFENRLGQARGGGAPLPEDVRSDFEARFGADFGGVRVHTGSESAELNQTIQAKAFTYGADIHFNTGQYDPHSPPGQRLLAHELTHTIQQGAAPAAREFQRTSAGGLVQAYRPVSKVAGGLVPRGTVQRDGDPFAPVLDKQKGVHDYRLNPQFDQAPKDWTVKIHNSVPYFYKAAGGQWVTTLPIILSRDLYPYGQNKFKDAIKELQEKLRIALGGRLKSGIWRRDGVFGSATEGAVEAFQKEQGLPETGEADYDTWEKLDAKASVGASFGSVSYAYEEQLKGSTTGTFGLQAGYKWKEIDDTLRVTVGVKFVKDSAGALAGSGDVGKIVNYIQDTWNIFKISYKSDNDGKQRRTKDTSLKLDFKVAAAGIADKSRKPVIFPDNQVLLWKGDHPNWAQRGFATDEDKKHRSDAGNWNMDDGRLKNMVGHEFGHLIGLEDEYSRSHADIMRLTGNVPLGTTKTETLTPEQQAKYDRLVGGVTQANNLAKLKAVNELVWDWQKTPDQVPFLMQEYKKQTGNNLNQKFEQAVTDTYWDVKNADVPAGQLLAYVRQQRALGKTVSLQEAKAAIQAPKAAEVWQEWAGNFPDGVGHSTRWNYWGGQVREYVSGGLMGDYSLIGKGKAETRPNAVAHEHAHPLEPRHVRRFAEYVSKYKDEVWEAEYR